MIVKKVKFLGFEYVRIGDVAYLKFLNKEIWAKIGNEYNFIGLNSIRKIASRKTIQPKVGKFNDFQIKDKK